MDNQLDIYGYNFFDEVVTPNISAWLNNPEFNKIVNNEYLKDLAPDRDKKSCVSPAGMKLILNRQTTNKERLLLLTLLAKHYEVKLYSTSTNEVFKDLTFCGTADYYVQMPKIFRCSKINLNATLRSIQSGIPLRCIDVMGCGGCLLTNYQKDFDDHFKDEENILFYRDAHEALEKADFYIKHDTLREKIALSGHETIKKYYDYPVKIKEMLEMADLQYIIKACGR
jgi:spore maturation protein CgeB